MPSAAAVTMMRSNGACAWRECLCAAATRSGLGASGLQLQIETAERAADYGRAAELKYGKQVELTARLREQEAALAQQADEVRGCHHIHETAGAEGCDREADGGHDECLTDRAGHLVDAGLARHTDGDERVVDAPHRAEEADERRGRADGGEKREAVLRAALDVFDRALDRHRDPGVQVDLAEQAGVLDLRGQELDGHRQAGGAEDLLVHAGENVLRRRALGQSLAKEPEKVGLLDVLFAFQNRGCAHGCSRFLAGPFRTSPQGSAMSLLTRMTSWTPRRISMLPRESR